MTEYEKQVLQDLSVLKSQMHQLMGIGQPGRLASIERRVACNEQMVQRLKGLAGAFGGLLTAVQVAVGYLNKHN